ncbi:sulfatase family protein [Pleomorphovibrio marinus]|uniref:sulfatase family protein n=1 Tax=Pleomorphovibrio marinus TaxID=2164132 RepID=UPI000E0C4724|nr:arylsulfatase [Pleomorphovibrio marinus]
MNYSFNGKLCFGPTFSGLLFLLLSQACTHKPNLPTDRLTPNIVFIFADDMGYGDISGLNSESKIRTPALDQLIHEGMVFTNAHASASVCTPSRYGLLTGRYAFRTPEAAKGIWGFSPVVIEPDKETLATLLKREGYTTGIVGKWHLGLGWQTKDGKDAALDPATGYSNVDYSLPIRSGPADFGFDYSFIHPASLDIPPYLFIRGLNVVDTAMVLTTDIYPRRKENTEYAWDKKHTDDLAVYWEKGVWWRQGEMSRSFRIEDCHETLVAEGLGFIERQVQDNPDSPFFLYLPLTGPHTPWIPSEKNKGQSGIGLYGDFVLDIDEVVERVRQSLIDHDILENTILVFASDNGAYWPEVEIELHEHDSNAGRRGQKGDVWDGGHRIPLIISWPGIVQGGAENNSLISLTDFMATFSEMADQSIAEGQGEDSQSFWSILNGTSHQSPRQDMVHHSSRNFFSIRHGGWKYIEGLGSGGFTDPAVIQPKEGGPTGQLYKEDTDPQEQENLFAEHPEIVAELAARLDKIRGN